MFALVLLGLLIPAQVPAIPLYIMLWQVGPARIPTRAGHAVLISVFGIFLMRQFFKPCRTS